MLLGKTIGPFEVGKELGAGAMGAVYLGVNTENGQKVAIKIIAPGLVSNELALKRFTLESAILKKLRHPHIVRLLASGRFKSTPFYVMEYVEGESLDHVLERRGRLTWEEVVILGQQLCAGLQHAHDKGIIHRDLKPSNLMILKDGTLKLTDFGIAKDTDVTAMTAANSTVGTAAYMSPEQCRGARDITNKSDLYSLGCMFYELLTGRKPFMADNIMDMFRLHTMADCERPSRLVLDIPIWLDTLVCQLMEKEPDKRPFNADTVSQSLAMVKEKSQTQKSAGIEAAKKRKIDKQGTDLALNDADRDAARTLLGKKKKKPKQIPIYQRGWFAACGAALVLAGLAFALYTAFRTPAADSLYAQAESGMKSTSWSDKKLAREEPIATFLANYPNDPRFSKVQTWADQYDRDLAETQLLNRRNGKFKVNAEGVERTAREALDAEEAGDIDKATKIWTDIAKNENSKATDDRALALVARKYLDEIKSADKLYEDWHLKVVDESLHKKEIPLKRGSPEDLAVAALRAEVAEAFPKAQAAWLDLKKSVERDLDSHPENRPWFILASKRYREILTGAPKEGAAAGM